MYGPPKRKKMTIFVDDINVPVRTAWGDQTTSETLRQLIEVKGFYSLEKPGDFCTILDTQVFAIQIYRLATSKSLGLVVFYCLFFKHYCLN